MNTTTEPATATEAAPQPAPDALPADPSTPPPEILRGAYRSGDLFHFVEGEACLCDHPYAKETILDRNDTRWTIVQADGFCAKSRELLARPGGAKVDDDLIVKAASGVFTVMSSIAKATAAAAAVPFSPRDTSEMFRLAGFLANSNLIPRALHKNPNDVLVVLLKGQSLGLEPMQSISGINVIDGKAEVGALMMVSMILKSGLCEYWELVESDLFRATYRTKRRGGRSEQTFTYTIEEAEAAGLTKKGGDAGKIARSPWNTQRRTMLRRRAQSFLAREVYPDICVGLYDHEELSEIRELEHEMIRAQMDATRAGFRVVSDPETLPGWMASGAKSADTETPALPEPAPAVIPREAPAAEPRDPLRDRVRKRVADAKPAQAELLPITPPVPDEVPCGRCQGPMPPPAPGETRMCDACRRELTEA